jgi:adenosine deaminase
MTCCSSSSAHLVDLHCHLEGALSPADLRSIGHGRVAESRVPPAAFGGFDQFVRVFRECVDLLQPEGMLERAIETIARRFVLDGCSYVELATSPFSHIVRGMSLSRYVDELSSGALLAAKVGLEVRYILEVTRQFTLRSSQLIGEMLTAKALPRGTVAVGVGGPESWHEGGALVDVFSKARSIGLGCVAHAGETAGPESVVWALDHLKPDRIGHGVRAAEDKRVLERLQELDMVLEVCVSSNIALGVYDSLESHPLPVLARSGIRVVIGTDDPGIFGCTLAGEYSLAGRILECDSVRIGAFQDTALASAYDCPSALT